MTGGAPLVELRSVSKQYGGAHPLRVTSLRLGATERVVLGGLDAAAAEMFVHLVCGAALPDEGDVLIDGVPTRDVTTEGDWLQSLDRFGLVTHRAVLVDDLPVEGNLAMPLTLSLDPIPPDVRRQVRQTARLVDLSEDRLAGPTAALSPLDRLRLHLARALAPGPRMLLLEHPTAILATPDDREAFGALVRVVAETRDVGWLAVTDDAAFASAAAGAQVRLQAATGDVRRVRRWWPW